MPRNNSSLLFLIILFLLIGLIGLGFIAFNRGGGGILKGGVITDEINDVITGDPIANASWNWTTVEVISTESTGSSVLYRNSGSIAVDENGNIHTVWRDYTNYKGAGPDSDIFYKCWFSHF